MAMLTALALAGLTSLARTEPLPKGYTAIKASARGLRTGERAAELGEFALPETFVANREALLAAPIRLEVDCGSTMQGTVKLISKNKESATWVWTGGSASLSARARMTADCDGFCWYEIRLAPNQPVKVRSITLQIPRTSSTARYVHPANFSWSNRSGGLPEMGGKWSSGFMPYVWLGNEDCGLAWCAESDKDWNLRDPSHALSAETQAGQVLFEAKFLDHEETITNALTFRFGLQATPVKPVSFAWRGGARILHDIHYDSMNIGANGRCELDDIAAGGAKTVVIHDSWTKYYGQMVPADAARFRNLIAACHKRGLRLLVYVGYGIARTAPELQGKHDEWSVRPLIPWNPSYKPETRGFDATCPRSGWADWLVAGTDTLFANFDLDGLYFDGTSEAWRCENPAHGCGWKDADGKLHADYPLRDARNLMRRIAEVVHRHKPDAILDVHMSSNFTVPTLSFCDSVWNGEQFEGHTSAEKFHVPLDQFRAQFMGYAQGLDAEFLCYENRPFTFDQAIALAWVHGVEVRPYPKTLSKVTPIWRAMDRFGVTKAQWRPYWKTPVATTDSSAVKISAWARKHSALMIVSHLDRKPERARITIPGKSLHVLDAITREPLAVTNNTVTLDFSGMSCRLLEVQGARNK
ncbi:MAG TPA: glycoside hydrolase domain-containing protein [Verrucomicrobiae bacterium]|nr:glycoside hydrolase domain-containing protein [Verrucomicrobiae bacterium]